MAKSLTRQVLAALDGGRLSAEEVLRAALRGKSALRVATKRAERTRPRRRSIYRTQSFPESVIARALAQVRQRLRGSDAVRSIHWGARQVSGHRTAQNAVVIHVTAKQSVARLRRSRRRAAPRHVVIKVGDRRFVVPVDVQAVGRDASFHIDTVNPADHAAI